MKKKLSIVYIISVLFVVGLVMLALLAPSEKLSLKAHAPAELNVNWQLLEPLDIATDLDLYNLELPLKLPIETDTSYTVVKVLGADFQAAQTLLVRSSLQNIEIKLAGDLIYSRSFVKNEGLFVMPYASLWNLIEVPAESEGLELSITLSSPFNNMSGQINPIKYGEPGELLLHILRMHGVVFLFILFIFILGLVLLGVPLLFKGISKRELVYLGAFSVLISMWLFAESRMLQFFIGNQFVLGSLAYLSLAVVIIPLLLYVKAITSNHKFHNIIKFLVASFVVNFAMVVFLQLAGIKGLFASMWQTHALIIISMLVAIYVLIVESKREANLHTRRLLISFGILVIFALVELGSFYLVNSLQTSLFMLIGLLIFIAVQSYFAVQRVADYMEKSYKTELYEKLAYLDQLTGAPNRMAFERDLQKLKSEKTNFQNYIGIFDLNDLKKINDTYGHNSGDQAIITTYQLLKQLFDNKTECYRIGGDEFACIVKNDEIKSDEQLINNIAETSRRFNELVNIQAEKLDYPYKVAQGYAYAGNYESLNIEKVIHKADQNMYEDKQNKKQKLAKS